MSANIEQIYIANPITTIGTTDLIYIGQSGAIDAAITGSDYATQIQSSAFNIPTGDTSVADVYAYSFTPTVTSLFDGFAFSATIAAFHNNSIKDPTMNVDGLGAHRIGGPTTNFLTAGDITSAVQAYFVYYKGIFILLNPFISTLSAFSYCNGQYNAGIDSGAADAYVVTNSSYANFINPQLSCYVSFTPLHDNATTTPTINYNTFGALPIYLQNGSPVSAGDITTTYAALLFYNGTHFQLMNPATQVNVSNTTLATAGTGTGSAGNTLYQPAVKVLTVVIASVPYYIPLHTTNS